MPTDGLLIGYLAKELNDALSGGRVDRVTQPEKDMLLLFVRAGGQNARLILSASPSYARAHLTDQSYVNPPDAPMFCMLMRKHLVGGRILSVAQERGDRILKLTIENRDELGESGQRELYLELMGRHSNLTLVQNGRIVDAIRHVTHEMSRVRQALPGVAFEMPPMQDNLELSAVADEIYDRLSLCEGRLDQALQQTLRGLSAATAGEFAFRLTGLQKPLLSDIDAREISLRLREFLDKLPSLYSPTAQTDQEGVITDVTPFPYLSRDTGLQKPYHSLSAALDAYFGGRDRRDRMAQRSTTLRRLIKTHLERAGRKLTLQEEELTDSARMEEYRVYGELLTAQAYLVPRGQKSVSLPNFYDENAKTVEIPLDVSLTPPQNAQLYFKKYRKARAAQKLAAEQKEKTLAEIDLLENALSDLDTCEDENDLKDVRSVLEGAGMLRRTPVRGKNKQPESKPAAYVSPDGLSIYVGKNAVQNERLTASARGGDLWLHAKDMPGSHVIVRCDGQEAPKATLECALRLAAFYSKGHGAAVPVDYTLRKYVKKPSGAAPGFVIYTNQKTVMVTCSEQEILQIQRI